MPVGAYAASREIMEHVAPVGSVYQAGTLSANPVAMAAGLVTLEILQQPGFYEELEAKTHYFTQTILQHCHAKGYEFSLPQIGSIFWILFSEDTVRTPEQIKAEGIEKFKKLHLECLKRGVYFGPSGYEVGFISAAHQQKDLDRAAGVVCESLDEVFSDIH